VLVGSYSDSATIGGNQSGIGPSRRACELDHVDTIHRTGFDTQIATGALTFDHGVHLFCSAKDGIDWAGLNAFGAANALFFANHRHHGRFLDTMFGVQRGRFNIQQLG
jgi:hypothetical protein